MKLVLTWSCVPPSACVPLASPCVSWPSRGVWPSPRAASPSRAVVPPSAPAAVPLTEQSFCSAAPRAGVVTPPHASLDFLLPIKYC